MRRIIPALLALVAGCGNIGSPEIISTDVYEFRDIGFGQSSVFHWPRSDLPVRIWVASDSPLRTYLQTAIDRWEGAFLFGDFRATIVTDSTVADVILRNDVSDIGNGLGARAPECIGETDQDFDFDANTLTLPVHVFVFASSAIPPAGLPKCYSITTTHEIGHVLGIISPSHAGTTAADVMFGNPVFDGISDRDRLTAVTLYSIPSTISIAGRR